MKVEVEDVPIIPQLLGTSVIGQIQNDEQQLGSIQSEFPTMYCNTLLLFDIEIAFTRILYHLIQNINENSNRSTFQIIIHIGLSTM